MQNPNLFWAAQRKAIIIKEAYHENTNSAARLSRSGVIFYVINVTSYKASSISICRF